MIIPKLQRSDRNREYKNYTPNQRAQVVWAYLALEKSHRSIDEEVLGLDSSKSKGYQAMGILHYLGLTASFKGLFKTMEIEAVIDEFKRSNTDDYTEIVLSLQLLLDTESIYVDDVLIETKKDFEIITEGQPVQYYTTRYERNPKNREAAIRIHGTQCMACGFDFEMTYGEQGKAYIEVHHIVPISTLTEEVEINPANDLAVVCSNCHRMIHRRKNVTLTIERLREIISENQKKQHL